MRNIKLTIEYEGTNYHGWQVQPNAITVQGEIVKAINNITKENVNLIGSGRTDSGVHAKGQVANFITNSKIPEDKFSYAINSQLPLDIAITKSEEVPIDFHSRYDAIGKRYRYLIYNRPIRSPLYKNYAYHIPYELDFEKMNVAKEQFLGTHDFKAFMSSGSEIEDTVRTIHSISITKQDSLIIFQVEGNGFLYNMVRIIVGTLVEVGNGKKEKDSISQIIKSKNRMSAGHTAPANGLYLEKVFY
ncbi:tRNA pseudouridine(38-40) synthase TruA [Anaerosalibacter sp. Marseille-P3206]|uniref:tRNA pseudouridine(38-40) synthase TruA n=1 Tax=Anaerosalibacter sp. Marseille-P3206 TaxID=1871005 RepID=UPI0009877BC5|nr:tRNA pseudouridine(38-40) synthase TruA [Anaerosalibacter sp. Marseille-P3206]